MCVYRVNPNAECERVISLAALKLIVRVKLISAKRIFPRQIRFARVHERVLCSYTVYNTKGTRAHTHRELIRTWLWEPRGSSLDYI